MPACMSAYYNACMVFVDSDSKLLYHMPAMQLAYANGTMVDFDQKSRKN